MTEEQGRPHISPTQINMFMTCPESWRRRYLMGEKERPGIAIHKGGSVHVAAEKNYTAKMETGLDMKEADLLDIAASAFDEKVSAEGVELSADEASVGQDRALGEAKDSAVRMTSTFRREIAPLIIPVLVEKEVRVELPEATHDIVGRMDVVDSDGWIHDLKTSKRRKTAADLETDQMAFYAAAYERTTGQIPAGVALDVVIDTKTPQAQIIRGLRDHQDKVVLAARVNVMLATIKAGVFPPAAPGSWKCSPRFCGYFRTCVYQNAERRAAAEANDGG